MLRRSYSAGITCAQFRLEEKVESKHAGRVRSVAPLRAGNALTHFATTRWSLIFGGRSAAASSPANGDLAELCQIYWRPILTFICRRGYPAADAQDLTQDFFLLILEGKLLQAADPSRGRFRSLLLKSLKNFLIDADVKRRRLKRGGAMQFVSWEQWITEAPSQLSLSVDAIESSPAEALFDLRWAATIAEQALRRLREECESKGHRRVYEVLNGYLTAERTDISYQRLSAALGVSEASVRNLLHEFRVRYRELLREEVAKTVEDQADVDGEIRYLCAALSATA
jgi:DNA-directed RNA polymerase specialized sigma24 family protein